MKKVKAVPDLPQLALPIVTVRMLRRERRRVLLGHYITGTSNDPDHRPHRDSSVPRVKKRPVPSAWLPGLRSLLAGYLPRTVSFERVGGIRAALFSGW
jgi:hypothetical protein